MSKVVLFSLILHLNAKVKRIIVKMQSACEYFVREETSELVRVFYWREKNRKSEYFCWFLRASKIPRVFLARVIQNFVEKKSSKTAIFEIEKSEEKKKKPMVQGTNFQKLFYFIYSLVNFLRCVNLQKSFSLQHKFSSKNILGFWKPIFEESFRKRPHLECKNR